MADKSSPSKKSKKERRAAKVQQKENAPSDAAKVTESSDAGGASAATNVLTSPADKNKQQKCTASPSKRDETNSNTASTGKKEKTVHQKDPVGDTASSTKDGAVVDSGTPTNNGAASETGLPVKKQLTKAERRELQEAQRKAKKEQGKPKADEAHAPVEKKAPKADKPIEPEAKGKQSNKTKSSTQTKASSSKFFSHLPSYSSQPPVSKGYIHPSITQIGLQYSKGVICGSNARAVALLCALKKVVDDYETPDQKDLARDLLDNLKLHMEYLHKCRPISVSMESVNKYISPIVLGCQTSEAEAKTHINAELDRFYKERIHASDKEIAKRCLEKIVHNDVILTFGHSSLVLKVLETVINTPESKQKEPSDAPVISVIVVDSRPKFEGREMVRKLVKACPGISCSYVLITAISHVMPRATKVLLGAHAVLANGYVMSRVGSSQIALMAKTYNVPLLVCCETYKFSHKMQTDSFVVNELADERDMMNINSKPGPLTSLDPKSNLQVLNLCYDVTPPNYVTGLITESGVIPCTSAPVVIRVKQQYDINIKT